MNIFKLTLIQYLLCVISTNYTLSPSSISSLFLLPSRCTASSCRCKSRVLSQLQGILYLCREIILAPSRQSLCHYRCPRRGLACVTCTSISGPGSWAGPGRLEWELEVRMRAPSRGPRGWEHGRSGRGRGRRGSASKASGRAERRTESAGKHYTAYTLYIYVQTYL